MPNAERRSAFGIRLSACLDIPLSQYWIHTIDPSDHCLYRHPSCFRHCIVAAFVAAIALAAPRHAFAQG
jgi:hypothetical protein